MLTIISLIVNIVLGGGGGGVDSGTFTLMPQWQHLVELNVNVACSQLKCVV